MTQAINILHQLTTQTAKIIIKTSDCIFKTSKHQSVQSFNKFLYLLIRISSNFNSNQAVFSVHLVLAAVSRVSISPTIRSGAA